MFITRHRLSKHVPAARNKEATIEEFLETMFSVGSAPMLHNKDSNLTVGSCSKLTGLRILELIIISWD
jgi:hypothetical protein